MHTKARAALRTRALLHRGDAMVWDRWRWLKRNLNADAGRVIDVGCGNGSLALNISSLGYDVLGLSYSETELCKAEKWAATLGLNTRFQTQDVRSLSARRDLASSASIVVCTEVIEHILDDDRLISALTMLLQPGGLLLLTTPSDGFRLLYGDEEIPWAVEDGRHVRKGYSRDRLVAMCGNAGLAVVDLGYCSGLLSQTATSLQRRWSDRLGKHIGWIASLPARAFIPMLDSRISERLHWPPYCICVVAQKPL